MKTQTPINKKRYEVQTYSTTSLTWKPTAHTDDAKTALTKVRSITVAGDQARVRDRKCNVIVVEAKPKTVCTKTA